MTTTADRPEGRRRGPSRPPWGRLAAATGLLFAALALYGARVHWVEEAGSAERDGYAATAEAIRAGELPRDPFRPALYPLAVAALAPVAGGAFPAARLLSNAAAAALAALAFLFGRRLAGGSATAGWWAFAAAAANPNLWIIGQHATTDMLFAALGAAALLAALAYLEAPAAPSAVAAGAALGLAAFTRGNAWFLLPGLLLAWWLAPRRVAGGGRRGRHLAAGAAAAIALLVPHWALRAAAFGDPFHDENWKNLAWKLHGYPDWSALDRVPHAGPAELLREDGGAIAAAGLAELARFAGSGLAQLLGTPLHALLFVAGAAAAVAWRRRPALWLLAAGGLFLAGVAFTFFAWGRLLLVLLPPACALSFAPWAGPARTGLDGLARRLLGRPPPARAVVAAGILVAGLAVGALAVKTALFRLPAFVARHPYAEVTALRAVAARTPPGTVLAGTSPFLGRYLERPYLAVPDAFGPEVGDAARYWPRLEAALAAAGARYLVAGPVDLRDRPPALLGRRPPVPWLTPAGAHGPVRVWRVRLGEGV